MAKFMLILHEDPAAFRDVSPEDMQILLQRETMSTPDTRALAALICLQSARLGSRVDERGNSLLLQNQDRMRWDQGLIVKGFKYLEQAASGPRDLSAYHLQAAIAACHARAESFEQIDWRQILYFYDRLLELQANAIIELNRAIALAYVKGPEAGLEAIENIRDESLGQHVLFFVTKAELLERSGLPAAALAEWRQAADCQLRVPQRKHVQGRIDSLSVVGL